MTNNVQFAPSSPLTPPEEPYPLSSKGKRHRPYTPSSRRTPSPSEEPSKKELMQQIGAQLAKQLKGQKIQKKMLDKSYKSIQKSDPSLEKISLEEFQVLLVEVDLLEGWKSNPTEAETIKRISSHHQKQEAILPKSYSRALLNQNLINDVKLAAYLIETTPSPSSSSSSSSTSEDTMPAFSLPPSTDEKKE